MKDIISKYLEDASNKRIKTREIENYVLKKLKKRKYSYQKFVAAIKELVQDNKMCPIKARGKNGRQPRLHNWYQIKTKEKKISEELKKELLTAYVPQLSLSYYFDYPAQYKEDKKNIKIINRFLNNRNKANNISVNERSFQLFNNEKFLTSKQGKQLLDRIGIAINDLNCYRTYEPFFYYQNSTDCFEKNILIIENKDTFFSLKKLLQEGISRWQGINFSLLIYGEGKKIQHSFSFFKELEEYQSEDVELNFYYFGDLDPEGIKIWWGLQDKYQVEFKPFQFFYHQLLVREREAPKLRKKQNFNQLAMQEFCQYFATNWIQKIKDLLQADRYLPQEGLNYQKLKELSTEQKEL
ncbi:MAG: Wadjet anti-phage system protein JetD domain-containing protein [Bacillota bacterium]